MTQNQYQYSPPLPLHSDYKYVAAKILTVEATLDVDRGIVRELEFLQVIAEKAQKTDEEGLDYLPILSDNFIVTSPDGNRHLCLVQILLSASVSALRRSAPTKSLPVYMVRNILYMVLQALATLHSLDIIHTGTILPLSYLLCLQFCKDVKLDNILFAETSYSYDAAMDTFLAANPPETEGDSLKSQPIPHQWTYETSPFQAELMSVVLVDLGNGVYLLFILLLSIH